jgi:putative transposase
MRKLLKKQGYISDAIVTDKLGSYAEALREIGLEHVYVTGGRLNNRAEASNPLPGSGLFTNHEKGTTKRRD